MVLLAYARGQEYLEGAVRIQGTRARYGTARRLESKTSGEADQEKDGREGRRVQNKGVRV